MSQKVVIPGVELTPEDEAAVAGVHARAVARDPDYHLHWSPVPLAAGDEAFLECCGRAVGAAAEPAPEGYAAVRARCPACGAASVAVSRKG